jgi:hypothetical protein
MFWSKQAILHEEKPKKDVLTDKVLSHSDWSLPEGLKFVKIEDVSNKEILDFISEHYDVGDVSTTILSETMLEWLKPRSQFSIIVNSNNEIQCFGLAYVFYCNIDNKKYRVGHTSFLTVRKSERNKGLAACCIRDIMVKGSKMKPPVYIGYHQVDKPIGKNAVKHTPWYRPLQHKTCARMGFQLKGSYQSMREKYPVNFNTTGYSWEVLKDISAMKTALSKFRFAITIESMADLITCEDIKTYVIKYNNIPIAFICYENWPNKFNLIRKTAPSALVQFYIGSPKAMKFVINKLKDTYAFMYFHQTGSISTKFLNEIRAIPTPHRYINLYNWPRKYTYKDFAVPFF